MSSYPVQLFVYDLSGGMARQWAPLLLGRPIEAIYHTGVVVHGRELYFGGGINVSRPGATPFGRPLQVLDLGHTEVDEEMLELLLAELAERWTPLSYRLLSNNCNNFSNELSQLLVGKGIPEHIVSLPDEVLATPFGQMIQPLLSGLEQQMSSMRAQAYQPAAAAAPAAAPAAAAAPKAEPAVPAPAPAPAPHSRLAAEAEVAGAPALAAAEVEIEAAIAEGMIEEAACAARAPGAVAAAVAGGAKAGTEDGERLAAELAVKAEFERLRSTEDGLSEQDALAQALEAVSPRGAGGAGSSNWVTRDSDKQ